MQINFLHTNLYNKNYGKFSEKNITEPQKMNGNNPQDIFIRKQPSQVAFTGFFSKWFKAAPQIVLSESEQAAQRVKKASQEINSRIKKYNDDPNLVIMSYLTNTPYTKENAYEFTKYLYSHNIEINKNYKEAQQYYKLRHRSLKEGIETAGVFNKYGISDAQKYSMHLIFQDWRHHNFFNGIGNYIAELHLCSEDLSKLKEWITKAIQTQQTNGNWRRVPAWSNSKGVELYHYAIDKKNIPLLKFLTEDLKLKPYDLSAYTCENGEIVNTPGIEVLKGKNHQDAEIRQFFDDEHLYDLLLNPKAELDRNHDYYNPVTTIEDLTSEKASEDKGIHLLIKALIFKEPNLYEKETYLNRIMDNLFRYTFRIQQSALEARHKLAAELPIATIEKQTFNDDSNKIFTHNGTVDDFYPYFARSNYLRAENIISKNVPNGEFTTQTLKNCLNDPIMSPEILIQHADNTSVLEEISKINVDDSNRAEMKEIVQKIRDMRYITHSGDELSNIAYSAAEHNNADLLQFLKENHVDLSRASKTFKNSPKVSKEIQYILSDVKPHDRQIVSIAHDDSAVAFHSLVKTKLNSVDINSRDDKGSTLLLESVKNGKADLIRELKNIDDVDWNITDSVGKNVLMRTIDYALKDPQKAEEIINILKTLPDEKFDINYINYCTNFVCPYPHTAIQYALSNKLSDDLLKKLLAFPNLDVNLHVENSLPTAYIPCIKNNPEQLKFLVENSDIDTLAPYNGKTLRQHLYSMRLFPDINSVWDAEPFERILNNKANNIFINKMKKIYEKYGTFTLEQINDFLNYGQIEAIQNKPLNTIGEKISHFIAEIFPNSENLNEVLELTKLFEKLKEKNIDMDCLDDINRSPMRKAVEADNAIIAKLFKDYGSKPSDIEEIKFLCKKSDNPQIKELFT